MTPQVPNEWKPRLRAYLRAKCGVDREQLSAIDFSVHQSVAIRFPDGSYALFRYAFVIWDETGRECAVFTEHCGYHVFAVNRTEVEVLQNVGHGAGE